MCCGLTENVCILPLASKMDSQSFVISGSADKMQMIFCGTHVDVCKYERESNGNFRYAVGTAIRLPPCGGSGTVKKLQSYSESVYVKSDSKYIFKSSRLTHLQSRNVVS
jgi:hypothetical protein